MSETGELKPTNWLKILVKQPVEHYYTDGKIPSKTFYLGHGLTITNKWPKLKFVYKKSLGFPRLFPHCNSDDYSFIIDVLRTPSIVEALII